MRNGECIWIRRNPQDASRASRLVTGVLALIEAVTALELHRRVCDPMVIAQSFEDSPQHLLLVRVGIDRGVQGHDGRFAGH